MAEGKKKKQEEKEKEKGEEKEEKRGKKKKEKRKGEKRRITRTQRAKGANIAGRGRVHLGDHFLVALGEVRAHLGAAGRPGAGHEVGGLVLVEHDGVGIELGGHGLGPPEAADDVVVDLLARPVVGRPAEFLVDELRVPLELGVGGFC